MFRRHRGSPPENGRWPRSFFYRPDQESLRRGFFLLPNLLTSASLFCGFWSITETLRGDYVTAAWLLIAAGVFDGLDGRVARMTNTTSAFGVQYDSLSDMVSFGVAPAVLAFTWALRFAFEPKIGWTLATMYVICGAFRLARFNVHFDPAEKTYMTGLAIPAASGGASLSVLFFSHVGWVTPEGTFAYPSLMLVVMALVAFLMVSRIKYYSFKSVDVFRRRPLRVILLVILFASIVRVWPHQTLYFMFVAYVLSGPVRHAVRWYLHGPDEDTEALID